MFGSKNASNKEYKQLRLAVHFYFVHGDRSVFHLVVLHIINPGRPTLVLYDLNAKPVHR